MTPTVRESGATEINVSTGLHGSSLQVAYAADSQTVLLASGHRWKLGNRWSAAGEAGAGRQWIRPNGGSWAIYAGGGYGAGYSFDNFCVDLCDDYSGSSDRVRYTYAFVQPTYTLVPNHSAGAVGFAVRLQPLYLNRWQTYATRYLPPDSTGYTAVEAYPVDRAGKWLVLVQPGINLRWRFSRYVGLTSHFSVFLPLQSRRNIPTVLGLASDVGLQVSLDRKSKTKPAY